MSCKISHVTINVTFLWQCVHDLFRTAEWVVGWNVHAELACAYLRAMQLLIICHFYLTMAFRVLRKSESVCARLSASALSMFLVYFTSFIIMGYVFANSPWFDCYGMNFTHNGSLLYLSSQ